MADLDDTSQPNGDAVTPRERRGLSRRHMIGASVAAGVGAWVAPTIMTSGPAYGTTITCQGVKIPSQSAINSGKVALCNGFETGGTLDLSCLVTDASGTYRPANGFFFKLCSFTATNLSSIAVKYAGNNAGCTTPSNTACQQLGDQTQPPFGASEVDGIAMSCTGDSNTNIVHLGGINQPIIVNGTTVPAPGAGCRWLFIDTTPNVNEIGLAVCFPTGSIPPSPC
jgi:hypothetical protein